MALQRVSFASNKWNFADLYLKESKGTNHGLLQDQKHLLASGNWKQSEKIPIKNS